MTTTLQFLKTLYPDPVGLGMVLVRTSTNRDGNERSFWLNTLGEAAHEGHRLKKSRAVYFAVALHDSIKARNVARERWPRLELPSVRGCHDSAVALPGLWAEIEVDPGDDPRTPPTWETVLAVLEQMPHSPSIIVWTGSSYQVYWVFRELWLIDGEAQRARARDLLRRLQGALRDLARPLGLTVKDTACLARMMRLPGTFNHELATRVAVSVIHFRLSPGSTDFRYRPADFDDLPAVRESATIEEGRNREDRGLPIRIEPVRAGCRWFEHCEEDQDQLDVKEWRAILGELRDMDSATQDSVGLAHRYSIGHPGYNPFKTEEALARARRDAGPRTCDEVESEFDADGRFCGRCPHRGGIKYPIDLGRTTEVRGVPPGMADPDAAGSAPGRARLIVLVFDRDGATEVRGMPPAGVPPSSLEREALHDLVHGLAELLEPFGGSATAREITGELARSGDGFEALRSALEVLIPRISAGEVPRSLELAGRLRSYRGQVAGGACIDQASKNYQGARWTVRKVA